MTAPITLVRLERDLKVVRKLRSVHAAVPTAVAFSAPAKRHTASLIADAVLDGLGCSTLLSGGHIGGDDAGYIAGGWLIGRGVTDALVLYPEDLGAAGLARTIDGFTAVGCRVWLISFTGDDKIAGMVGSHQMIEAPAEALDPFLAGTPKRERRPFPFVPRVDGIKFRPVARATLSAADFAVVDSVFLEHLDSWLDWFDGRTNATAEAVACRLREIGEASATTDEFIVAVRAAQAAGLRSGRLIKVDTPKMCATCAIRPRRGQLEPAGWNELFRYRDPAVPAVAALYSEDFAIDDLGVIELGHLTFEGAADGSQTLTVEAAGKRAVLAGRPAQAVAAQAAARRLAGATSSDRLFVARMGPTRGMSVTGRQATKLLNLPVAEVGIAFAPKASRRSKRTGAGWATLYGIKVRALGRTAEEP